VSINTTVVARVNQPPESLRVDKRLVVTDVVDAFDYQSNAFSVVGGGTELGRLVRLRSSTSGPGLLDHQVEKIFVACRKDDEQHVRWADPLDEATPFWHVNICNTTKK
jgi:hypothetical protein